MSHSDERTMTTPSPSSCGDAAFAIVWLFMLTTVRLLYILMTSLRSTFRWLITMTHRILQAKTKEGRKGSYLPLFNEASDMWAFGVVLWEIASYGKVYVNNTLQ